MSQERMSIIQLFKMFPDDATAERWFAKARWPNGIRCPYCESDNVNKSQEIRNDESLALSDFLAIASPA